MLRKVLILFTVFIAGCTSPEEVRDNVLHDLEAGYNTKFAIHSIDMNHDEGNWGSASLLVYPSDDEALKFRVNYNYSEMRITWEEYKGALWNRGMAVHCSSLLGIPLRDIKAVITSNNSIAFNSMVLPYSAQFTDIIRQVNKPRIGITLKMNSADYSKNRSALTDAAESFLNMGFEKVSMTVSLLSASGEIDVLKFKITQKHHSPSASDLNMLLKSRSSASFKEAGELFNTAVQYAGRGEMKDALKIYMEIIKRYDTPYRYDPYILF